MTVGKSNIARLNFNSSKDKEKNDEPINNVSKS